MDDAALIKRHIEQNPDRPGFDDVRLAGSAVPVWALIGHWKAVGKDAAQVVSDYRIPEEEMNAALAYYRKHRAVINARLTANRAPA